MTGTRTHASIPTQRRPPIAEVLARVLGERAAIRVTAYDGSAAGPSDAAVQLHVRTPRALNYLVTAPGELGLARAYVAGDLDFDGGHYEVLRLLARDRVGDLTLGERAEVLRDLGPGVLRPVEPPPQEFGARRLVYGLKHSRRRDAVAVAHHYDVSNQFYEWVLGPSMAYTCAVYPHENATLEEAQAEKFDLVCRKLGLRPGMRLLDVGCGWGGMVLHAAREYGVHALGVTLSRQQAEWAQQAIADAGLEGLAEVRFLDYRDVPEGSFDAISSIGLTEHIGLAQLPAYVSLLHGKLRPAGRLLNHSITRPTNREPVLVRRGFINRYVFPDGEILGAGRIITELQDGGFEVRHVENLREHYARTTAAWSANLDAHWDEAVEEVGEPKARVWALYLAGSRLGFEQDRVELHQVLAVKTDRGRSGMPLRPDW